ncbi:MAG: hypothetical protein WC544_04720 [Patescibacteria group bacterium]
MNNLSQNILEKIKQEKVKPIPRWEFLLKDWVIWTGFGVSVLIGSVAYCVALFMLTTQDWDLYRYVGSNPIIDALSGLPYIWLVALILFMSLAYYNFRHTQSGYRYRTYGIVLMGIGASIVIGSILHVSGFGDYVDNALASNLPMYRQLTPDRQSTWTQPEKGLLAGKIIGLNSADIYAVSIKDFRGQMWVINVQEAVIDPRATITDGEYIKIIGRKIDSYQFIASQIMPWQMSRWIEECETTNDQSVIIFPNGSVPVIIEVN